MFKRLFQKRWLGVPITLLVVMATILSSVGVTAALWQFQRPQGATVNIKGFDVKLYSDALCTTELLSSDLIAFGDLLAGSNVTPFTGTSTATVYAKSPAAAAGSIYLTLSSSILPNSVTAKTGTTAIPIDPATALKLYTPAVPFTITPVVTTDAVPGAAVGYWSAVSTDLIFQDTTLTPIGTTTPHMGGPSSTGFTYIRVDNEIIKVNWPSIVVGNTIHATSCVRGQLGTTAAAHNGGSVVVWSTYNVIPTVNGNVVSGGLAPGAIQPIPITLLCGDYPSLLGVTNGFSFNVVASPIP